MLRNYRVLLVDLAKSFGGAEVRVLTQARAMQDQVAACSVAVVAGSPLHERLIADGLPCEPLSASRGSPRLLRELRRVIRRGQYTIVDAHNVQSILWGHFAALLAGAPGRVATVHSDYGREYPGIKGWLYEGVLWLNRRVAREYINVTEVLQAKSERSGDGGRSTLIYNAVPVPPQPPLGTDPAQRAAWGYDADAFVVASIARLKPVKGHTYLIDAFAALRDLPHVKLLIVGDGPLRAELEQQVIGLKLGDRVQFAGFRRDVPDILRAADCVCMASLSEALPYVVLEAGANARPLLVTKVGGMATLLDDHDTALLVPPQDSAALADGIRWLAAHPDERRQLGLNAYALVRDHFSVDTMITQILEVYDRALR